MRTRSRMRQLRRGIVRIGLGLTVVGFVLLDLGLLESSSSQPCALARSPATVIVPLCPPTTTTTRPKPPSTTTTTTTKPSATTTTEPSSTTTTKPPPTTTTTTTTTLIPPARPPGGGTGILAFTGTAGTLKLVGLALMFWGQGSALSTLHGRDHEYPSSRYGPEQRR